MADNDFGAEVDTDPIEPIDVSLCSLAQEHRLSVHGGVSGELEWPARKFGLLRLEDVARRDHGLVAEIVERLEADLLEADRLEPLEDVLPCASLPRTAVDRFPIRPMSSSVDASRMMTTEERDEFLEEPLNAHLACVTEDGHPYAIVCWYE